MRQRKMLRMRKTKRDVEDEHNGMMVEDAELKDGD